MFLENNNSMANKKNCYLIELLESIWGTSRKCVPYPVDAMGMLVSQFCVSIPDT